MKKTLFMIFTCLLIHSGVDAAWTHIYVDIAASDTSGSGTKFDPLKYISQIGKNELLEDSTIIHIKVGEYNESDYPLEGNTTYIIGSGHSDVKVVGQNGRPLIFMASPSITHYLLSGTENVELKGIKICNLTNGECFSACSGTINIVGCSFHNTSWTFYNINGTMSFFDCDIGSSAGSSHIKTTGGTVSFDHVTFSDTSSTSTSCTIFNSSQSATSLDFSNCAFDYVRISSADLSLKTSFSYCIYSNNVSDRATYAWSASYNGDPVILWDYASKYWIALDSSPVFGQGNDGLDIGNLNNAAIRLGVN